MIGATSSACARKTFLGDEIRSLQAAEPGVEKAVANFREFSQIGEARSNPWNVPQERMKENLGNLQKLRRLK
jgi:hypothetical protein